jgi:hypothetical protein
LPEGKINGESDLKESSTMLEQAILIYNQTGASK